MGVNSRFDDISRQDFLAVADRFQVPSAKALLREVKAAFDDWPRFEEAAEVSHTRTAEIAKDFSPI
jgi:serine/threonine-protein kinase HipA